MTLFEISADGPDYTAVDHRRENDLQNHQKPLDWAHRVWYKIGQLEFQVVFVRVRGKSWAFQDRTEHKAVWMRVASGHSQVSSLYNT